MINAGNHSISNMSENAKMYILNFHDARFHFVFACVVGFMIQCQEIHSEEAATREAVD